MNVNTLDQAGSSEARLSSPSSRRCGTPTSRWSSQTSELAPEDQLHQFFEDCYLLQNIFANDKRRSSPSSELVPEDQKNWNVLSHTEIFATTERRAISLAWSIIIIIVLLTNEELEPRPGPWRRSLVINFRPKTLCKWWKKNLVLVHAEDLRVPGGKHQSLLLNNIFIIPRI